MTRFKPEDKQQDPMIRFRAMRKLLSRLKWALIAFIVGASFIAWTTGTPSQIAKTVIPLLIVAWMACLMFDMAFKIQERAYKRAQSGYSLPTRTHKR